MNNSLPWILLAVLFLLDLLFAAVRASLINARLPQLLDLREDLAPGVDRTLALLEKPRTRATVRLSLALTHFLLAGTLAWVLLTSAPELDVWINLLILLVSVLLVVGLEFWIERSLGTRPETWALRLSGLALILDGLLSPATSLLIGILGRAPHLERRIGAVTEDELKTWVEVGQSEGGLEKGERQMIYSIFEFGDTITREVMVPRMDVLAMDVDTSLNQLISALTESGHSRIPIYEGSIDNIIGLLYVKDLLRYSLNPGEHFSLRPLLRPPYFVPEAKKVDDLLAEMQSRRVHMAVVVDEYGGTAGLVTLEDIVEEIVGEIRDEYDSGETADFERISDDEFIFAGRVDLDDVNAALETDLPKDLAETLGGYIYGVLGRVPLQGEHLPVADWLLTIEQVSWRRIRRVRASRQPPTQTSEE
ncbi:MAG TPA: transporter associated domain-containing protein [Anaerolineaceae bacterium]|nr:transporter associated domain-containing protein [Anaerolineaceae bacterium]HQH85782.1 transporter associated domain-containing protein [Anaerolineaceae bacterium]